MDSPGTGEFHGPRTSQGQPSLRTVAIIRHLRRPDSESPLSFFLVHSHRISPSLPFLLSLFPSLLLSFTFPHYPQFVSILFNTFTFLFCHISSLHTLAFYIDSPVHVPFLLTYFAHFAHHYEGFSSLYNHNPTHPSSSSLNPLRPPVHPSLLLIKTIHTSLRCLCP